MKDTSINAPAEAVAGFAVRALVSHPRFGASDVHQFVGLVFRAVFASASLPAGARVYDFPLMQPEQTLYPPNQALHRTRPSRSGCNHGVPGGRVAELGSLGGSGRSSRITPSNPP